MRRAFLVTGPESSGTRMMTRALVAAGVWGDADHPQRLDNWNGETLAAIPAGADIVLRRSVPHGEEMPPLREIVSRMEFAKFSPVVLLMCRDPEATARSQVRNGHVAQLGQARARIREAMAFILNKVVLLPNVGLVVVPYAAFAELAGFRSFLFQRLGLEYPRGCRFSNANLKYFASTSDEPNDPTPGGESMHLGAPGTNPCGLPYDVANDGSVRIGSYTLSPADFGLMVSTVQADSRYQATIQDPSPKASKVKGKDGSGA